MPAEPKTVKIGVLADTHIPDRLKELPPGLIDTLKAARVDRIIHAGDVCQWKIIRRLEEIAPMTVVQGNRDWLMGMHTPHHVNLTINGVQIAIAHGHHSIINYTFYFFLSKLFNQDNLERYYRLLIQDFPHADLIIFGHTHYQTACWVGHQLLFNPGAAYPCQQNRYHPRFGIVSITAEGVIRTEWHTLQ
jgi:putative phosphoesterase